MTEAEYLAKVLDMARKACGMPALRHQPKEELFECDLCFKEVPSDDLTMIEFRNSDMDVCSNCADNLPEEYPEDEDMFRGDR